MATSCWSSWGTRVEYFISFSDYYQKLPNGTSAVHIAKTASINEGSTCCATRTTRSLFERRA